MAASPSAFTYHAGGKPRQNTTRKGAVSIYLLHFHHCSVVMGCHTCVSRNWSHLCGFVEISKQKVEQKNFMGFCSLGLPLFHKWFMWQQETAITDKVCSVEASCSCEAVVADTLCCGEVDSHFPNSRGQREGVNCCLSWWWSRVIDGSG